MPIPTSISDLSPVAASNSPAGSDNPVDGDNFLRAHASIIRQLYDSQAGAIYAIQGGAVTSYATLAAAVSGIGSNRCTVVVQADVTMAASATFPSTATLRVENNSRVTTTGFTLTVNGPREFHDGRVFVGTGTVVLARGFQPLRPQWWGAVGDGSTDSDAAFASMTTVVKATTDQEQTIILEAGDYRLDKWVLTGARQVTIVCRGAVFITGKSASATRIIEIDSTEPTPTNGLSLVGTMALQATGGTSYAAGLYTRYLTNSQIDMSISGAFSTATADIDSTFDNDFKWFYCSQSTSNKPIIKMGSSSVNANRWRVRVAGTGAANGQTGIEVTGSGNMISGDVSNVATAVNFIAAKGAVMANLYTEGVGKSYTCTSGISRGISIIGGTYEVASSSTSFDFSGGGTIQGLNIHGVRFKGIPAGSARQAINWGTACYGVNLQGHDFENIDTAWTGTLRGATGGGVDQLVGGTRYYSNGVGAALAGTAQTMVPQTVSGAGTVSIDASAGDEQYLTVTTGSAFTIGAPTNLTTGQLLTLNIRNNSGGALGAITWNAAFKMAAWTSPANTNSRSIVFRYDGSNWVERFRTPADVPN
jgi:hypothetical protein